MAVRELGKKLPLSFLLSLCRDRRDQKGYHGKICSSRSSEYVPYIKVDEDLPDTFIRLHPWEAKYLFNVASISKIGIVEIGRYIGGSSLLMASATEMTIHSFDIWPRDDERILRLMEKYSYDNIKIYVANSQKTDFPKKLEYDILFVDGDHTYSGCFNDLTNWYPNLKVGGHVVVHDSYKPYKIPEAIMDFTFDKNVRFFLPPLNVGSNTNSYGSLCHFQKLDN